MLNLNLPLQVRLHYQITTPMFLGGADQKADGEHFRNASYKGALRFWWRALHWGGFLHEAKGNIQSALIALHKKEGELFGRVSDGRDSCQSRVHIRSRFGAANIDLNKELKSVEYLLGQGLYHFREGVLREYISGGDVGIALEFLPETAEEDVTGVVRAAIALGLFGAMGSRGRRGLGSLSLNKVVYANGQEESFTALDDIKRFVASLDFSAGGKPPFTAFCNASRIVVTGQDGNALKALAKVGDEMQLYRGYGRFVERTGQHEVNGKKARQNFKPDHDNVLQAARSSSAPRQLPVRSVFGLPHNYYFSSVNAQMDIAPEGGGRRASPLLIHVHALEKGRFAVIQTLLPAVFLHEKMAVEAKPGKGASKKILDTSIEYKVINQYIDGFKNQPGFEELRRG